MVASLIEPQINYNEDLNIDTVDKNTEVSLFKLTLLDVEVVIALGQLNTNATRKYILFSRLSNSI